MTVPERTEIRYKSNDHCTPSVMFDPGHPKAGPVVIQHGKTGSQARGRDLTRDDYRERRRGYGARMGTGLARSVVT